MTNNEQLDQNIGTFAERNGVTYEVIDKIRLEKGDIDDEYLAVIHPTGELNYGWIWSEGHFHPYTNTKNFEVMG